MNNDGSLSWADATEQATLLARTISPDRAIPFALLAINAGLEAIWQELRKS